MDRTARTSDDCRAFVCLLYLSWVSGEKRIALKILSTLIYSFLFNLFRFDMQARKKRNTTTIAPTQCFLWKLMYLCRKCWRMEWHSAVWCETEEFFWKRSCSLNLYKWLIFVLLFKNEARIWSEKTRKSAAHTVHFVNRKKHKIVFKN